MIEAEALMLKELNYQMSRDYRPRRRAMKKRAGINEIIKSIVQEQELDNTMNFDPSELDDEQIFCVIETYGNPMYMIDAWLLMGQNAQEAFENWCDYTDGGAAFLYDLESEIGWENGEY